MEPVIQCRLPRAMAHVRLMYAHLPLFVLEHLRLPASDIDGELLLLLLLLGLLMLLLLLFLD